MFVVALVNRKGGCGKSTLATHLAVHFARNEGSQVGLCDLDRQQSATTWLKLRESQSLPDRSRLRAWLTSARTLVRPSSGWSHLVLDTPGGMEAMDLARVVMAADVVLLPLRDSLFDRLATEQCVAELRRLPRVAQGRCQLALVGIGLPNEARGRDTDLADWAQQLGLPMAGGLRETAAYGRCPEKGLSVFDRPSPRARQIDLPQWDSIFAWLGQAQQSAAQLPRGETRTVLAAMRQGAGSGRRHGANGDGSTQAVTPTQPGTPIRPAQAGQDAVQTGLPGQVELAGAMADEESPSLPATAPASLPDGRVDQAATPPHPGHTHSASAATSVTGRAHAGSPTPALQRFRQWLPGGAWLAQPEQS